MRDKKMLK
jgi:hypothetical protein